MTTNTIKRGARAVTIANLEAIAARINHETHSLALPYVRGADGVLRAQVGNYHISQCYGGVCLCRMVNEGGATADVLMSGHVSRRELQSAMFAFIQGLHARPVTA